jgi:transcription elongation factor Elf1
LRELITVDPILWNENRDVGSARLNPFLGSQFCLHEAKTECTKTHLKATSNKAAHTNKITEFATHKSVGIYSNQVDAFRSFLDHWVKRMTGSNVESGFDQSWQFWWAQILGYFVF